MSYIRQGQDRSDVYVYQHANGLYACQHGSTEDTIFLKSLHLLRRHLERHVKKGDHVPQYVFDQIEKEIKGL